MAQYAAMAGMANKAKQTVQPDKQEEESPWDKFRDRIDASMDKWSEKDFLQKQAGMDPVSRLNAAKTPGFGSAWAAASGAGMPTFDFGGRTYTTTAGANYGVPMAQQQTPTAPPPQQRPAGMSTQGVPRPREEPARPLLPPDLITVSTLPPMAPTTPPPDDVVPLEPIDVFRSTDFSGSVPSSLPMLPRPVLTYDDLHSVLQRKRQR